MYMQSRGDLRLVTSPTRAFLAALVLSICTVTPVWAAEMTAVPVIIVKNVCIARLPGYKYSVNTVVDFQLVRAYKSGKKAFTVYVGNSPDLKGPNNQYGARSFIDASKNQYIQLGGSQQGHVLGVPKTIYQKYFHLMASNKNSDYSHIVESVRFCAASEAKSLQ